MISSLYWCQRTFISIAAKLCEHLWTYVQQRSFHWVWSGVCCPIESRESYKWSKSSVFVSRLLWIHTQWQFAYWFSAENLYSIILLHLYSWRASLLNWVIIASYSFVIRHRRSNPKQYVVNMCYVLCQCILVNMSDSLAECVDWIRLLWKSWNRSAKLNTARDHWTIAAWASADEKEGVTELRLGVLSTWSDQDTWTNMKKQKNMEGTEEWLANSI